jgi:putative lipoic acid-binding regulatory protein
MTDKPANFDNRKWGKNCSDKHYEAEIAKILTWFTGEDVNHKQNERRNSGRGDYQSMFITFTRFVERAVECQNYERPYDDTENRM